MKIDPKYIIGIDEAGRGPLAGPVAVGVVCVPRGFNWDSIDGVGDSKKVTPKNREAIFRRAQELQKEGKLHYAVGMVSAKQIDAIGIVPAIAKAMNQALKKIQKVQTTLQNKPLPRQRLGRNYLDDVLVKLDGGLKAPKEYLYQETIIKGDAKEKVIGLASIMAKVTRDRYMVRTSALPAFAPYTFAIHKGYGTKAHRTAIKKYGLASEHRKSFCTRII